MGRVFRFEEIIEGRVPTAADFINGKHDIIATIEQTKDILGAILCGSLLHGTYNSRSDIDIVLYHLDTPQSRGAIAGLRKRNKERNLDVNIVPIDPEIAFTRYHTISWGFLQHLHKSIEQGGLIKENFLDRLNQDFLDPLGDAAEYISFKLRYLGKSIDEFEGVNPHSDVHMGVLQKGLELPVHVARKYLGIRGIDAGDESKRDVINAYVRHAPVEQANQLLRLVAIDKQYTELLDQQIDRPDARSYFKGLKKIASHLSEVIEFVRANAIMLDRQVGVEAVLEPQPASNYLVNSSEGVAEELVDRNTGSHANI